jgi:hypothetical protein
VSELGRAGPSVSVSGAWWEQGGGAVGARWRRGGTRSGEAAVEGVEIETEIVEGEGEGAGES